MSDYLDRKYAHLIVSHVDGFKIKTNDPFLVNFRCPFCHDSLKSESKARGYLIENDKGLRYFCHNCDASYTFSFFLKLLDDRLFKEYCMERFSDQRKFEKPKEIKKEEKKDDHEILSLFEEPSKTAIEYLKSRKIDKKLFYISDFSKLSKYYPEDTILPKDERIIIPINNRQGKLVGLSARAIGKSKLRYILLKLYQDEPLIYNIDNIKLSEPVYIFEGAFDSMFLNNSIAVNGSDLGKVFEYIPKDKGILIYDNQPRNKQIITKMLNSCNQGYNMVIWPNMKEKDVNDMILSFGKEKSQQIIKDNIYQGLSCRAKISSWRKI